MSDQPADYGDHRPPAEVAGTAGASDAADHADGADPRVAAAVARLDQLGDTPPAEHVEVYEDVHRVLQDALADAARGHESASHEAAALERPGSPRP